MISWLDCLKRIRILFFFPSFPLSLHPNFSTLSLLHPPSIAPWRRPSILYSRGVHNHQFPTRLLPFFPPNLLFHLLPHLLIARWRIPIYQLFPRLSQLSNLKKKQLQPQLSNPLLQPLPLPLPDQILTSPLPPMRPTQPQMITEGTIQSLQFHPRTTEDTPRTIPL